jgi:hypothetical protein
MPRIPGVPDLDPVNLPQKSPAEAGRTGEAISQLGEVSNDVTLQQQGLNLSIKKAQQHVDTLAARNQMDAAYANIQNQLAKTQNSRDVPDVVEQGQKTLNDISSQWSSSPASVAIQMDADSLRPGLSRVGTVRQVDLMGKELKINLNQQAEALAGDYASGNRDAAVAAFGSAVKGGVDTGLMGDAEANEYMRQFKIKGQGLQIKLALQSPDPGTNMAMVNQLEQHPEDFPDLKKEDISDSIAKGTAQFETHTRELEWAHKELVKNTVAPAIIKNATDEKGDFHLDWALTQASHLSPEDEEDVAPYLHNHAGLANAELSGNLNKSQDQIEEAISHNKFNDAMTVAASQRDAAEKAGSPWYANQVKRIDSARREANATYRANYNFDYAMKKKEDDMASTTIANQLLPGIVSGRVTEQQLTDSLGEGKLNYSHYLQLNHVMSEVAKDPDTKKALAIMGDALTPLPKDASPDTRMQDDELRWNLFQAYQQGVGEKNLKGDDKTKYAMELVKPYVTKQVADKIDKMFGTPSAPAVNNNPLGNTPGESIGHWLGNLFGKTDNSNPGGGQPQSSNITQSFQGKSVPGMVKPGNLDITRRPNIDNGDGTHSSTFSMSFGTDNGEVLVPGVGDGTTYPARQLRVLYTLPNGSHQWAVPGDQPESWKAPDKPTPLNNEALDQYQKTGKNFGTFKTVKEADAYAQKLHEDQAKYGNNGRSSTGTPKKGDTKNGFTYDGVGWTK